MTVKSHGNFFDRHLGTVVTVAVLFFGQIATYAVLQSRVNNLEDLTKDTVKQSEHKDTVRRIETLEYKFAQDVVPRSEHTLRDADLNKRLDEIKDNVKEIRDRVEIIDNRGRGVR